MSKFKDKTQGFIMGLFVGLIVSCGFFVLKLDNYFKELNFYKTFIHTFTSESKSPETTENTTEEKGTKEKVASQTITNNKFTLAETSDTVHTEKLEKGAHSDSLTSSLIIKDSIRNNSEVSDDIVVRKDELLTSKTLEVINVNPVSSKNNSKDSLLQRVSGVQDDKNSGKMILNIEFWQSPINYKGYKMSKYKVVLFGIASAEGIKLFKSDDAIYMRNQNSVYKLDYASELKPYEKVSDESLISKLK